MVAFGHRSSVIDRWLAMFPNPRLSVVDFPTAGYHWAPRITRRDLRLPAAVIELLQLLYGRLGVLVNDPP